LILQIEEVYILNSIANFSNTKGKIDPSIVGMHFWCKDYKIHYTLFIEHKSCTYRNLVE